MLHLGNRHRRILDAEVSHVRRAAPEVGDQGVVRVQHELGMSARGGRGHGGPAVGDRVELAVPVELVAEQIPEQDPARRELGHDPVQPELVDLEQSELARRSARHSVPRPRGSKPRRRPCSRPPGCAPPARRRGSAPMRPWRRWSSCRWLRTPPPSRAPGAPKARRSHRAPERHEHLAGQAGTAAAPGSPREFARPRAPRRSWPSSSAHRGTIMRTAAGSTRTVTGSSAIASPSA